MRVQDGCLPAQRGDDSRVAMTHVRHIVIGVQVPLAVGLIQPHALAAHQVQRLVVEEGRVGAQNAVAPLEQ